MELKETEYVAVTNANQKGIRLKRILKDFGVAEKET